MCEEWEAHPRDSCYFCGEVTDVIQTHHIVPRRHGGSDSEVNLVDLCPTCHRKLERLYGERFYMRIGASETDEVVAYMSHHVQSELRELESEIRREIRGLRDGIDAAFSDGSVPDDIRTMASSPASDEAASADVATAVMGLLHQEPTSETAIIKILEAEDGFEQKEIRQAIDVLEQEGEITRAGRQYGVAER